MRIYNKDKKQSEYISDKIKTMCVQRKNKFYGFLSGKNKEQILKKAKRHKVTTFGRMFNKPPVK